MILEPTPIVRSPLAGLYFMYVSLATRLPAAEEEHVEREQVIVVVDAAAISTSRKRRDVLRFSDFSWDSKLDDPISLLMRE